ncbi:trypsin [Pilimelia terevasa]|uniref:Trypsin n=1 Tax=Pilimelia terevasa TaxID=53372 RepID=A0A8J3BJV4_9ACTN|nr:serine protease [Pilimelia terevasa]GGK24739.1 trypsin [Pilimelia terevasa]
MKRILRTVVALAATGAATLAPGGAAAADPGRGARIIGGTEVADESLYPWMTKVQLTVPKGVAVCGGSQVSRDIVLTAAHCFLETSPDGRPSKVTLDIGKVDASAAEAAGQRRTGAAYRYGKGARRSDWAVIRLDQPYEPAVYPALPADASLDTSPTFRATGWGMVSFGGQLSRLLRHVDAPLVPDSSRLCSDDPDFEKPEIHICAGDDRRGTCMGDSGGPLLAPRAGTRPRDARPGDWTVVGITSWGYGCGSRGTPGFYAQVSVYVAEIRAAIAALGGQQPR